MAAGALVLGGMVLIGIAIASQRSAPQPVSPAPVAVLHPSIPTADSQHPFAHPSEAATLPRSKPIALDIPSIEVHSTVQYLGQAPDGTLEVPAPGPHYDEAAWYRYSPTPGSLGPAVILGHVDSAANGPSVFFRLGELQTGDRVSITRADGSITVFTVDEVRRYPKDHFPTQLVYGDIDHAGLRILTCGGAFDNATGHYLDNIVVFASLTDWRAS